jgi:hypothetical protein
MFTPKQIRLPVLHITVHVIGALKTNRITVCSKRHFYYSYMWEFPIIEDPGFGYCPFNCPIMNSSDFCAPNGDSYFGPQVEPCLRSFDFTLRFENLFLSIAPSVLFLLIAPIRIFTLRNEQKRVVGGSTFQIIKLVSISIT